MENIELSVEENYMTKIVSLINDYPQYQETRLDPES